MSLNIGDNFSYLGKKFLDNRQSFDTLELMNNCSDVPIGFITFCKEDNKRYEYTESGWVEYSTSISNEQVEKIDAAYIHSQTQHVQPSDLEEYVTDEELNNKGYLTNIPEEYVTETELNAKGYLTKHQDLSGYVSKEELEESLTNKFDNVEVNETESNDTQTALDFYANGEVVKTVYFTGGGGGNVNTPPYVTLLSAENNILGLGEVFNLELDFLSGVTGKGTLKVFINDMEVVSKSISQGENTIPITDDNFIKGSNRITLYVIDRTGTMSNSVTLYVRYGSLEIASDFDVYTAYEPGAVVRYYFTPNAVDTSLALTMYMNIDGEVKPGVSCQSDTRGYYTFPNNLNVGSHYCQAYIIDSAGNTSNILAFNLIILDDTSLIVASDTINPSIEEGEQLSLDYKVYMKNNTSFITKIYIDDNLVDTGTCGLDFAYYRTSNLTEGIHTVKLEVYNATETVSDYIIWTVTITPSTYQMLEPVNAGALFIGTAQNMTNSSEGKEIWKGKDQDGNIVNGILNNFAFNSESGWVDNELLITGASNVEIPITPLVNNARYGFTLDIEFASKMIGIEDALVLNLWDEEKDCGIKITTEKVILRSAEGNQADLYFTDSEMTSVIFVIDRNELKAKIYLNGVMCRAFHLSDYSIDGIPYLEDFTVNNTIMLGGSGHARIKNLRVYQVALTTDEILNNFMANERNKNKQKELVEFQKGNHLPTLTIYCDFSGLGKDDKKPCSITYVSTDEEKYGKSFTLSHKKSTCQYQGTSSMAYPIKNYRINLADEKGEKWKYDFPYGKPERRFTLKADFMSSGHWTNTGLTKWINNNLYNYDLDDEKTMNPKKWHDINNGGSIDDTRECIYGFPCRLILINDGQTPLNEGQNEPTPGNTKDMGIFNFNHDKDATDTMGFDDDVFPNCASYEVTANSDTSAGAFMRFKHRYSLNATSVNLALQWTASKVARVSEFPPLPWTIKSSNRAMWVMRTHTDGTSVVSINEGETVTITKLPWETDEVSFLITNAGSELLTFELNGCIFTLDRFDNGENLIALTNQSDELEYYKQSFELRFPDEEDVPEGWGFMGVGEEGTGLKALIDWVDNCTDEEFVRDFDQHFNRDYTLRYFLLVITLGMVDNLGKNMMLDTWDNKIFMPRFYDCDTICSYDNSGQLKFAVDIEMAQGYWNTSSSRLWTRIRDLMHDELVAKYNNMRQNGLSYESLMECFYDEQIAKIPQKYYNLDYDVKYAPFADSYIGMANGDVYEHVKRWLQQRLRFVDTLYDYAPSYNNDVLTIRANTTEPMTLEIETYTPVYQHLSWYNNQMDKKKIDGKTSVTFTGTAMAETDQEVLIYGGSNIKSIKGITSMNPNRMLIGSATRLIELDAPNCPLLADINANKANLAPHIYLNKVNLSGCPLLGGNLIINQSPLVREIDIHNTSITGLNLPTNLRNLEVLKLPSAIKTLTLNDASQLHTLEFDEGVAVQNVTMTNCNALTNITNFNLEDATNVILNNSYDTVNELYLSKTTNLSVSNMPNLERIVYTPNAEHEVFDKVNVDNALNYTISTFNCPKLNTFITTAPYRESYGKEYGEVKPNEVFEANSIDISNTQFTDVKLLCTTDTNVLKLPQTVKKLIVDSAYDLDTNYLIDGDYDTIHTELYEPYNTDYEGEVYRVFPEETIYLYDDPRKIDDPTLNYMSCTDYIPVSPNSFFKISALQMIYSLYITQYDKDKVKIESTNSPNLNYNEKSCSLTLSPNTYYVVCQLPYNRLGNNQSGGYKVEYEKLISPNLIPSASDGSIIQSMYVPTKTVQPASGVWDLKGLVLEEYYAFGLNNDVKLVDNTLTMPERYDEYSLSIKNKRVANEIARYTASDWNTFPAFNSEFTYTYNIIQLNDGVYEYSIIANNADNLPTSISFNGKSNLLTVEYLKVDNVTNMGNMFNGCSNLTSLNLSNFDTSKVIDMSNMFNNCTNLTSLDLSSFNASEVTDMSNMFNNCTNLTSLDLSSFNASEVTDMQGMFNSCRSLTSLDLSNFNTSNVTNMHQMFYSCSSLTSLDVSSFNTSKVTNMSYMFDNCSNLTNLDLSNFNTNEVTDMSSMFNNCTNLTLLDISNFDTKNVTNMGNMFNGCSNLTSLNLSNFDTSEVTNMYCMFYNCNYLTSLDLSSFNTSEVTDMQGMFYNCNYLTSLDISNFDTSKVTNMYCMFYNCNYLTSLDLSKFNTSIVTNMQLMFHGCSKLTNLDLSSFDTSKVTDMGSMFSNCSSLKTLNVEGWPSNDITQTAISTLPAGNGIDNLIYVSINFTIPTGWILKYNNPYDIAIYTCDASGILPSFNDKYIGYTVEETDNGDGTYTTHIRTNDLDVLPTYILFNGESNLLTVEKLNVDNVTNMRGMFQNCTKLTSLYTSNWNTSKVTNMSYMFNGCSKLTSLDVSKWDTSKVPDMYNMFYNCRSLTSLDVSNWNTSNVTGMNGTFAGCANLTSITFGNNFNTSKVTTMKNMFYSCGSLTSLDLSNFNTSIVTNMSAMFRDCDKLTSITFGNNFNTSKVTDMNLMFSGCTKLTSLDVSNFDTSKVTDMSYMFNTCSKLTSLNLSNFNTSKVTNMSSMFYYCYTLTSLDSMINISTSLSLSDTKLDTSSLLDVIDNLAILTTTQKLTLGSTLLDKLTAEQIAVATNKGWTVV